MARSIRCSCGASGVVTCSGFAVCTPPTLAAAVVMKPVENAGGLKHRSGQIRRRGLAVRACDANDSQFAARVAIPPGCSAGQGAAPVVDDNLQKGRPGNGPLHDRCGGTVGGRSHHEVVTVGMDAGHGPRTPTTPGRGASRT